MWLSNSSVGRKLVMAVTGAVLVLFVTFHCLMNAVAICWPAAYNSVCEFLGANWYALIASAGLALFILIHIIYAVMLTVQNRRARGHERYAINRRPNGVEWSSQNMLVLGIVILAFLVVHLIQFWAKMQLQEIRGVDEIFPPAAGTLFLQLAFETPWTLIVYGIGFVALWFHLNHGMWSMFQSVGWNNSFWKNRLKKIALWWTSIVVVIFFAEGIVFTIKAHEKYYLTDESLREQYFDMALAMNEKDFGPNAAQIAAMPSAQAIDQMRQQKAYFQQIIESPEVKAQLVNNPEMQSQFDEVVRLNNAITKVLDLFDYLESADNQPKTQIAPSAGAAY